MSDIFDKQTENTAPPSDCTLKDVYDFVKSIYAFCVPDEYEPGNMPFGVVDYYNMESLGAWLKKQEKELARLQAIERAAKLVSVRMPKKPEPDENGDAGMVWLSVSSPIWDAVDELGKALGVK